MLSGEMVEFIFAEDDINHIEPDLLFPDQILFIDGVSIKTTDGAAFSLVTGSASERGYRNGKYILTRFAWLTSFLQLSPTTMLIADSGNHCIRHMKRDNVTGQGVVTDYVGSCQNFGHQDRIGTDALFYNPMSMIRSEQAPDQIFVAEHDSIRAIDTKTLWVTTIIRSTKLHELSMPREMLWVTKDSLMLTTASNVKLLQFPDLNILDISGGFKSGFQDGELGMGLYSYPEEILHLQEYEAYVLADRGNNRLRILDLVNNKVSSICTGVQGNKPGDVGECELQWPHSLLLHNKFLYVGHYKQISRIFMGEFSLDSSIFIRFRFQFCITQRLALFI